jgi:hypothetical protein
MHYYSRSSGGGRKYSEVAGLEEQADLLMMTHLGFERGCGMGERRWDAGDSRGIDEAHS